MICQRPPQDQAEGCGSLDPRTPTLAPTSQPAFAPTSTFPPMRDPFCLPSLVSPLVSTRHIAGGPRAFEKSSREMICQRPPQDQAEGCGSLDPRTPTRAHIPAHIRAPFPQAAGQRLGRATTAAFNNRQALTAISMSPTLGLTGQVGLTTTTAALR